MQRWSQAPGQGQSLCSAAVTLPRPARVLEHMASPEFSDLQVVSRDPLQVTAAPVQTGLGREEEAEVLFWVGGR